MSISIAVPKETKIGELRVAITPFLVNKLVKLGANITIESGAGAGIHAQDMSYKDVNIVSTADRIYSYGDVIIKVQPPTENEVTAMKDNSVLISFNSTLLVLSNNLINFSFSL